MPELSTTILIVGEVALFIAVGIIVYYVINTNNNNNATTSNTAEIKGIGTQLNSINSQLEANFLAINQKFEELHPSS